MPLRNKIQKYVYRYERHYGILTHYWEPFETIIDPFLNILGMHYASDGFIRARRWFTKDYLAYGYFQSSRYFSDTAATLRSELTPIEKPEYGFGKDAAQFAQEIESASFPVCLHWRRGDYFYPQNKVYQVCTSSYYSLACREIKNRWPSAELFVFSDDLSYVKANLDSAGLPVRFAPDGNPAAVDLALMRRCKAFVLSNSSFSWWAQWLANVPADCVYVPDHWFASKKRTALYEPGMIRLPTDK